MKGSSLLMFLMWKVLFERFKSVQIFTISPAGLEPMPYTSVALVQIVHIIKHDSADTGSLPKSDLSMANSNYFQ
jgi:hypothetical protein